MKFQGTFLALVSILILSCGQKDPNKQIDEGKVKGEIYESKEIGWSIEIPKGWSIVSKDKVEEYDEKGKEAIEKSQGIEVDTRELKHLISFKKDQFNVFASTSEPFKEEYTGEYNENNRLVNNMIYQSIADQGIKIDSASGKEMVQGLEFNTFNTIIYNPEGKVILQQILYSKLINGFDFGVNINYNNEEDKKTLIDAWKKSKFTK